VFSQRIESERLVLILSPSELSFNVIEHRNDIAEAVLDINIAVCDGK
jgi:hypothetical protein